MLPILEGAFKGHICSHADIPFAGLNVIVDCNARPNTARPLLTDISHQLVEEAIKGRSYLLHAWSDAAYLGHLERCNFLENDIICWHSNLLFKCLQPRFYPCQSRLPLNKLLVQFDLFEPEHPPYL